MGERTCGTIAEKRKVGSRSVQRVDRKIMMEAARIQEIPNQFLYIMKPASPRCNKNLYNSGKSLKLLIKFFIMDRQTNIGWEREYSCIVQYF